MPSSSMKKVKKQPSPTEVAKQPSRHRPSPSSGSGSGSYASRTSPSYAVEERSSMASDRATRYTSSSTERLPHHPATGGSFGPATGGRKRAQNKPRFEENYHEDTDDGSIRGPHHRNRELSLSTSADQCQTPRRELIKWTKGHGNRVLTPHPPDHPPPLALTRQSSSRTVPMDMTPPLPLSPPPAIRRTQSADDYDPVRWRRHAAPRGVVAHESVAGTPSGQPIGAARSRSGSSHGAYAPEWRQPQAAHQPLLVGKPQIEPIVVADQSSDHSAGEDSQPQAASPPSFGGLWTIEEMKPVFKLQIWMAPTGMLVNDLGERVDALGRFTNKRGTSRGSGSGGGGEDGEGGGCHGGGKCHRDGNQGKGKSKGKGKKGKSHGGKGGYKDDGHMWRPT